MNLALTRHTEAGLRLDDLAFPDRLMEALGPRHVCAPEVNPVSREDTIRFVNGLSRSPRAVPWFEPPPSRDGQEMTVERFRRRADRSELPEAELRMLQLLDERRDARRQVQAVLRRTDNPQTSIRR